MEFEKRGMFFKVDDGQGIAYGWAIVCSEDGKPYVDLQGDHIPEAAMLAAAEDFSKNSRVAKDMHEGGAVGEFPFIYPVTKSSKDLGIDSTRTGLLVGFKPSDPAMLDLIKSGERTGFSIGGVLVESVEEPVGKSFAKAKGSKAEKTMRTFRTFKIHEISLVDVPAQEGATVGYVKRAVLVRTEKATWSTSYIDSLPDSSFLYVEAGGEKKDGKTQPLSLRHFPYKDASGKIDLPHLRDAASRIPQSSLPAALREKLQRKAEKLIAAQHDDSEKRLMKRALLTTAVAGHVHLLDDGDGSAAGETDYRGMPGEADGGYHSHPWVRSSDGTIVIGESENHVHVVLAPEDIDAIVADGEADDDEDDAQKRAHKSTPTNKQSERALTKTEKPPMNFAKMLATVLAMTAPQQAYVAKLAPEEQEALLQKPPHERDAILKAAEDADPVVYKTAAGLELRKSAGDVAVMLAKQNDELAKSQAEANEQIAKEKAARQDAELTKRASEILKGVAPATGKALLKAIDGIADEKERAAALAVVKSGLAATERLMKASDTQIREGFELPENGAGQGGAPVETADDKLRKHVEGYQAQHKIPTYQQAFAKAIREDATAKQLYAAARN